MADPDVPDVPDDTGDAKTFAFDAAAAAELRAIRMRREYVWAVQRGNPDAYAYVAQSSDASDVNLRTALDAARDADDRATMVRNEALDRHLTALSFSGGGIRSATFAVGILQGLANLGLLRRFDYLSTVSGGGYAGAWLAAWIKRDGDPANVERELDPSRVREASGDRGELLDHMCVVDEEPEPLFHLRQFSSYMMPRPGALSADTWTIIAIWLRNVLINLLMIVPLAMLLVLSVRAIVQLHVYLTPSLFGATLDRRPAAWAIAALGLLALMVAYFVNSSALSDFRRRSRAREQWNAGGRALLLERWSIGKGVAFWLIIVPLVIASGCITAGCSLTMSEIDERTKQLGAAFLEWYGLTPTSSVLGLLGIAMYCVVFGLLMVVVSLCTSLRSGISCRDYWSSAFLAGASGGLLLAFLVKLLASGLLDPCLLATFAAPLAMAVIVAAQMVEVALLGRRIEESEREWWSRLSAMLLIAAFVWIGIASTIIYLPALMIRVDASMRAALAAGWVGTTAAGVLAGRSLLAKARGARLSLAAIATVAPPIFLAGLLGLFALTTAALVLLFFDQPALLGSRLLDIYWNTLREGGWRPLAWLAAIAVVPALLGFHLIDVNLFSLNAMYANRLARAYLGASRWKSSRRQRWSGDHDPRAGGGAPIRSLRPAPAPGPGATTLPPEDRRDEPNAAPGSAAVVEDVRNENPVTGFDLGDDISLMDFKIGDPERHPAYWGPHLLINTSLNLVGGRELAWRNRLAESFTLSSEYCGSKTTGYAPLEVPDVLDARRRAEFLKNLRGLTLARAISISGAAVDPNMSFYQSAPLTALLTIFNARLGYWIENPDRDVVGARDPWSAQSPRYGGLLEDELLGRTDGQGKFVHLSDGGHFENLGVYELIRRRARYIVSIDAAEDPTASDENLSALIRLVRSDFGVRIQLDTRPIRVGEGKLSLSHVVVGKIRYDDLDHGHLPGVLIYVKTSLTGDEPADVQNYSETHAHFPHQKTDLRQAFDESQFESYSALGDHIARAVFGDAVEELDDDRALWTEESPHNEFVRGNRRLFAAVLDRWSDQSPESSSVQIEASRAWIDVHRDLRLDPALARLSRELYPEQATAADLVENDVDPAQRRRAELHAVAQMLQIMEDAWYRLGIRGYQGRPVNQGWMNVFARWASARSFHRLWPTLRPEFSREFVRFCEARLHLASATPRIERLAAVDLDKLRAHTDPIALRARFADDPRADESAILALADEFALDWPTEVAAGRDVVTLVARSEEFRVALRGTRAAAGVSNGLDRPLIWLAWLGPEAPRNDSERFACGIVLARADDLDPKIVRLFAWIRPVHRSLGLGARFLEAVLADLKPHIDGRRLRIRYPAWPHSDATESFRVGWRAFFGLYDFRDLSGEANPDDPDVDLILDRQF